MVRRKYPAETASFIEEGIRPLVVALSRWGFDVCFSCQGHPRKNAPRMPYVAFTLENEYLGHPVFPELSDIDLKKILTDIKGKLKGAGWGVFYKDESGILREGKLIGYVMRPCKGRKSWVSVNEITERIRPLKPRFCGWVYHNK